MVMGVEGTNARVVKEKGEAAGGVLPCNRGNTCVSPRPVRQTCEILALLEVESLQFHQPSQRLNVTSRVPRRGGV